MQVTCSPILARLLWKTTPVQRSTREVLYFFAHFLFLPADFTLFLCRFFLHPQSVHTEQNLKKNERKENETEENKVKFYLVYRV